MDDAPSGSDICVTSVDATVAVITISVNGTSGNRSALKMTTGSDILLDFSGADPGAGNPCFEVEADYWTIDGFEIQDCPRAGIGWNTGNFNNVYLLNIDTHDNGRTEGEDQGYGVLLTFNDDPCYCLLQNITTHDNYAGGVYLQANSGGRYFLDNVIAYENDGCQNQDGISIVDTPYTIVNGGRVNDGAESGSSCLGVGTTQLADYIDLGQIASPCDSTPPLPNHHILVQNVLIYRSPSSSTDETGMKVGGCAGDVIIRGLKVRNVGNNLHGYEQPFVRVAIYHNTFVADATNGQNNTWWHTLGDEVPGGAWGSMHLENNAFISAGGDWTISFWGCCSGGVNVDDSAMRYEGNTYNFSGTTEVLWDSAGTTSPFNPTSGNFNTWRTQTGWEVGTSGYSTQSLAQTFVDYANDDFTPASGSDLIDRGEGLTLANGAGSGSTSLTPDEWWYFKGDWGMSAIGEVADSIRIGSGSCVSISSINENTGVITLASARTWSDNDPIYWCRGGADFVGSAPDAGAVESGTVAGGPSSRPVIRIRTPRPGDEHD